MKFISLFSGIGGFDLGLEQAGLSCVVQVENNPNALAILGRHWPTIQKIEDVKDVKKQESVDVICGGFPCQDVSSVGKRAGLAGERSGLWFEFHRIIDEICPKIILIENVAGLLSSNDGMDMATILKGLEGCGYWWAYRVLNSKFFGVAQYRRRVFIVASLERGLPQKILFEQEFSPKGTPNIANNGKEIATAVVEVFNQNCPYLTLRDAIPTLIRGTNLRRGSRFVGVQQQGKGIPLLEDTDLLSYNDFLKTNDSGTDDMVIRKLTPAECEQLQGFPIGWTEGQSDTIRFMQLANAVTVPVAKWLGQRIFSVDSTRILR